MAELAAASAAIGITDFALRSLVGAYNFIDGMKKAPVQVQRIGKELGSLQKILSSIVTKDDDVPIVQTVAQEMDLAIVIQACAQTCEEFVEKIQRWMPDSANPSLQAHFTAIKECRNVVRDTKETVTLAEAIATK